MTRFWCKLVRRLGCCNFGAFLTPGEKADHFVYVCYVSRAAFPPLTSALGRVLSTRPGPVLVTRFPRSHEESRGNDWGFVARVWGQRLGNRCREHMGGAAGGVPTIEACAAGRFADTAPA